MPFKSQAQRRKFAQLLVQGKISPETFEEWNRETGNRKLPERAGRPENRKLVSTKKKTVRRTKASSSDTQKKTKRAVKKRKPIPLQKNAVTRKKALGAILFCVVRTKASF